MKNHFQLEDISIRTEFQPGDMGNITSMHANLYTREYQFGAQFETYVDRGLREFIEKYDPKRSRAWICEYKDRMIGSLFLMDRGNTAQLRYLLIEPRFRRIGLGTKLMTLFMDFMNDCGYRKAYLWTTNELTAAAALYKKFRFQLTEEKESTSFGKTLIEQRYDLFLRQSSEYTRDIQ